MSKKWVALFLALLLVGSMNCVFAEENADVIVTDMYGREITFSEPVTRIIALSPAECEILCALGCEQWLVGRGEFCDYPASVLELPALATGDHLNLEEILALDPQVLVMADMNQTDEQVKLLEDNGVKVVLGDTTDIAGVYTAIRMLGALTGKNAEAEKLVEDMQSTFDRISEKCADTEQTIYFEVMPLEWGLWSAGTHTFMHELAGICGMQNAFADIDGWKAISQEQVIERDPDYIVLVTGMGDTAVDEVLGRAGWGDIQAVKNGRVYNADSYAMTRPGPRLKDAALDLYEFLYGEPLEAAEAAE